MARPRKDIPWLDWRDGVAYVKWYDIEAKDVKRLSLRTRDPVEAKDRYAAFLVEGGVNTGRPDELTVTAALEQYYREHVEPNVVDKERQRMAIRNLKAYFGEKPISSIDIPTSRRYADARRAGVIGGHLKSSNVYHTRYGIKHHNEGSDGTIRRELGVLVAAGNHAKRWKRIEVLPSVERPPEKRLGQDDEAPYYTREEIDTMTMLADGELLWFIELAYWTGARRRSIEALDRSQIRLDQKRILLQKPGKKATRKRQPIVPIFRPMEPALTALLDRDRPRRLFDTSDFYRPFRRLCEGIGIPEKGCAHHPHLLRHSRATHLLQGGKSLYSVARLLGDTVATVERVYGHHSVGHIAADLDEMD